MLYSNPHGGSRDMAMIMAYLFSTEFGKKQSEIAQFLGVSQSTVHQWIKEISYKKLSVILKGNLKLPDSI